jgi:nitrogen fixation protein NifU and related proteins
MTLPYSAALLEHYRRPRNFGSLPHADVQHEVLNPLCGDRIRLELALAGDVIADVRFRGDACAICTASASLLTEVLRSLALKQAGRIGERDVLAALQAPVPDTRLRCALLPLEALRGCLDAAAVGDTEPHATSDGDSSPGSG